MVTRDRNRIALQSDLLGAASLGIKNILCLSGYHQTLINCPDSSNVYDIDSTQFIELVNHMSEKGTAGRRDENQRAILDVYWRGGESFPEAAGAEFVAAWPEDRGWREVFPNARRCSM